MAKSFNIFFESVTQATAMRLLGLSGSFTEEELKAAYRKAAKANHPDRGGSTDAMQQVNASFDLLKGSIGSAGVGGSFKDTYAARKAKDDAEKAAVTTFIAEMFDKFFDVKAYLDYFKEMSGKTFTYTRTVKAAIGFTSVDYKFVSEDNTVFFDITAMGRVFLTKSLGAGPDKPELSEMGIMTEVLVNRAKHKMTQANYNRKETEKFMKDPKVLFPATKLKKIFAAGAKKKAIKRADYVLTFEKVLGAKNVGKDYFEIDLDNGFKLYAERQTFMRKGVWSFSVRDLATKKMDRISMMPEGEQPEVLDMMVDVINSLKGKSETQHGIVTKIKKLYQDVSDIVYGRS